MQISMNNNTNSIITCSNKFCPQNTYSEIKIGIDSLCPTCADRYKNQFYCVYCHQVYFQTTDDGKNWIQCDQCKGWVHELCDEQFVTKNQEGTQASYKCIKCRKVESKDVGILPRRNNFSRGAQPKIVKKVQSGIFFNIGFQMALKPEEIAQDIKKLQSYLK